MPMVTLHKVGEGNLYHLHVLDRTDPGYGQGHPGGHPDQGLPGHGHPDNSLPGRPNRPDQGLPGSGGRPDNSLPGSGAHPGNRPPGSGNPAFPDNSLPSGPPPHVPAGTVVVLVRDSGGVWHYASLPPGSPPPRPLPPQPDQGLPPTAQPKG